MSITFSTELSPRQRAVMDIFSVSIDLTRDDCITLAPFTIGDENAFSDLMRGLEEKGMVRCHHAKGGRKGAKIERVSLTPAGGELLGVKVEPVKKIHRKSLMPCMQEMSRCLHGRQCYLSEKCRVAII